MGAKMLNGVQQRANEKHVRREAESLIRKLTQTALTTSSATPRKLKKDDPAGLLFSGEVDGVRCLLVKTETETPQAAIVILSPREKEIARMIAKGFPNKAIAAVLDISVWTVSTHLRRIFAKMGVNSRAAMVARMSSLGLLM